MLTEHLAHLARLTPSCEATSGTVSQPISSFMLLTLLSLPRQPGTSASYAVPQCNLRVGYAADVEDRPAFDQPAALAEFVRSAIGEDRGQRVIRRQPQHRPRRVIRRVSADTIDAASSWRPAYASRRLNWLKDGKTQAPGRGPARRRRCPLCCSNPQYRGGDHGRSAQRDVPALDPQPTLVAPRPPGCAVADRPHSRASGARSRSSTTTPPDSSRSSTPSSQRVSGLNPDPGDHEVGVELLDGADPHAEVQRDAGVLEPRDGQPPDLGGQRRRQRCGERLKHFDLAVVLGGRGRDLGADPAGAATTITRAPAVIAPRSANASAAVRSVRAPGNAIGCEPTASTTASASSASRCSIRSPSRTSTSCAAKSNGNVVSSSSSPSRTSFDSGGRSYGGTSSAPNKLMPPAYP